MFQISSETLIKGKHPFPAEPLGEKLGCRSSQAEQMGELFCAALQVCKMSPCIRDLLMYKKTNVGINQSGEFVGVSLT